MALWSFEPRESARRPDAGFLENFKSSELGRFVRPVLEGLLGSAAPAGQAGLGVGPDPHFPGIGAFAGLCGREVGRVR
jgi:hypothetical protein